MSHRVLLVNDRPLVDAGGGVEVHVARLAAALEAAGDHVEVLAGEIEHRGAGKLLDLWDPGARRLVRERARRFGADVVHHHNVVRELSPAVFGVPRGVATVLTVHDHRLLGRADGPGVVNRLRVAKAGLDQHLARRHVDAALGVSEPLTDALRQAGFRRAEFVPPLVADLPAGLTGRPPAAGRDVVFAGRLAPDKGVDVLLDAVRTLHERAVPLRLVVAGDGPLRPAAEALAHDLGPDAVVVLGRVAPERVLEAMAGARAVVVPSDPAQRLEGLPTVALEAIALGRPLVVGPDPGLRSLVEAAGCGEVVAASPTALAEALAGLLADPERADHLGAAGAAHFERHHRTEVVVARLRRLYDEVTAARAGGGGASG